MLYTLSLLLQLIRRRHFALGSVRVTASPHPPSPLLVGLLAARHRCHGVIDQACHASRCESIRGGQRPRGNDRDVDDQDWLSKLSVIADRFLFVSS